MAGLATPGFVTLLRAATGDDVAAVHRLTRGYDGLPDAEPDAAFLARYERVVASDDWGVLVADEDGTLTGYALVQDYGPGLRRAFSTGRLHDLYVDPAWRRSGIGQILMGSVTAWCLRRPPMVLDWQARPEAVPFYEALGFVADRVGDLGEYPAFSLDLRQPG